MRRVGFAPSFSSISTILCSANAAAAIRGVQPSLSHWFTLAPALIRSFTHSAWLCRAATCTGDIPASPRQSTSYLSLSKSVRSLSVSPSLAASKSRTLARTPARRRLCSTRRWQCRTMRRAGGFTAWEREEQQPRRRARAGAHRDREKQRKHMRHAHARAHPQACGNRQTSCISCSFAHITSKLRACKGRVLAHFRSRPSAPPRPR